MPSLTQHCHDILYKNLEYTPETPVYLLYDEESPLARLLSISWIRVLSKIVEPDAILSPLLMEGKTELIRARKFENPPQPLYRGGLINPENPHTETQNRIITGHNLTENEKLGLDHHRVIETTSEEIIDPQIESIKSDLMSLPKGAIVILVQSTNFRLSTFRIRLELFHRGVHVVEFNHLAYIPEEQFPTFIDCLAYRTEEYVRQQEEFTRLFGEADETKVISTDGSVLRFGPTDKVIGNTGDYRGKENKGGTFPLGEVLTEALDLETVSGSFLIDTYPTEDFSIEICEPFLVTVESGRVLPSNHFPEKFAKLYNWIVEYEGEVMVRELGLGLNPAISTDTPLRDINFHERKVGVHLSLGKKHGIYGKKLPKTELQRFHIDVFIALDRVEIGGKVVFSEGRWRV